MVERQKLSVADLTSTMLKPSSVSVVQDSNSATITTQGLSLSSSNGATLITAATQGADERLMFPVGGNATPTDQMAFVMIARKSAKASTDAINFRVGYDATTNFAVSSTDWQVYRVPLNDSASPYVSLYSDQGGPLIECKYFALTKVGVIRSNLLPNYINLTTDWSVPSPLVKDTEGVNEFQLTPRSMDKTSADLNGAHLNPSSTYGWTFWARADNAGDIVHTELWGGSGHKELVLTAEWKRYQSQGQFKPNYQMLYFWGLDSNKGNVYVKLPYLYKE
ncbi:MAG: hypothetical protein ACLSH6_00925 [Limosilactobacillus pontis]